MAEALVQRPVSVRYYGFRIRAAGPSLHMAFMSASSPTQRPRRSLLWLLQFRLRTLLLLPLLVAVGLMGHRAYVQARALIAPTMWDVGSGQNIKWSVPLGTLTFGSPVVAGGKVYVGTNNGFEPPDLGVLMCLRADDGTVLWRAKSAKLPSGRAHDHPLFGIQSSPAVEGNRLWYVTNRCEVVCLDTEGFHDNENDGLIQNEPAEGTEADVVWSLDMFNDLGVRPHLHSRSSPAIDNLRVFVVTGNGVTDDHRTLEAPQAPSFLALDKRTGKVLWSDNSPGENILHGQWGSPVYAVLGGVPQVIFPGGDGWLYSFDPAGTPEGKSKLLWKFDINPKGLVAEFAQPNSRNEQSFGIVIHAGRVFATCGQDPEHGEGIGFIWCIDPTRRGDVSAELVLNASHPGESRSAAAAASGGSECRGLRGPQSQLGSHLVLRRPRPEWQRQA